MRAWAGPRRGIAGCCLTMVLVCCGTARPDAETPADTALRVRIEATPVAPWSATPLRVAVGGGEAMGMVSWLARDPRNDTWWVLQRGDGAEPVLNVDAQGHVLRAFGRGAFRIPHAIRVDPQGHVWTVDAGSSRVVKWSAEGQPLLTLDLAEGRTGAANEFGGATDVAFGPSGEVFVSDGYVQARVVAFDGEGRRLWSWGTAGDGPGQFHLPHSIAVDRRGAVYVADRENGRIEVFDTKGRYLRQMAGLGRTYALAIGTDGRLWASMQPMGLPPGSPGWIVSFDPESGKMLGHVTVTQGGGLHGLALDRNNHPVTDVAAGVLWFRGAAPAVQPAR